LGIAPSRLGTVASTKRRTAGAVRHGRGSMRRSCACWASRPVKTSSVSACQLWVDLGEGAPLGDTVEHLADLLGLAGIVGRRVQQIGKQKFGLLRLLGI